MANRTTFVDNNTWNNSHIALVGKAMSSTEEKAYKIMRTLGSGLCPGHIWRDDWIFWRRY